MTGEIVHYEIPAKNPEKLSKFYANTLGWKFKDSRMPNMKYWMISRTNSPKSGIGGMYKKTAAKQIPTNYISVTNIDSAISRIKKNGGRITTPKQAIPQMGWSAQAEDPEGNALGLFQFDKKVKAQKR